MAKRLSSYLFGVTLIWTQFMTFNLILNPQNDSRDRFLASKYCRKVSLHKILAFVVKKMCPPDWRPSRILCTLKVTLNLTNNFIIRFFMSKLCGKVVSYIILALMETLSQIGNFMSIFRSKWPWHQHLTLKMTLNHKCNLRIVFITSEFCGKVVSHIFLG